MIRSRLEPVMAAGESGSLSGLSPSTLDVSLRAGLLLLSGLMEARVTLFDSLIWLLCRSRSRSRSDSRLFDSLIWLFSCLSFLCRLSLNSSTEMVSFRVGDSDF